MPSTYSTRLRLELQANGENAGLWGEITNRNLGTLLETAIAGVVSIALPDANYTLTTNNGLDDQARYAALTFTGTLTATRDVIVPSVSKIYRVLNNTNQSLNIKTSGGVARTVLAGKSVYLFVDGTDTADVINDLGSISLAALSVSGNATFGDAAGDTVTINGTAVSIPNGLNFDSNTLFIDSTNNFVGVGTSTVKAKLNVNGGGTVTSLAQWNTLANSMFELANPAVRLGIGYLASDVPAIQGFDNINAARDIVLQPFGGNAGLGVPPSAWGSSYRALDMTNIGSFHAETTGNVGIGFNTYYSASEVPRYKSTGPLAFNFRLTGAGIQWLTAPSGTAGNPITFTQAMTLTQVGDLILGSTASDAVYSSFGSEVPRHEYYSDGVNSFTIGYRGAGAGALPNQAEIRVIANQPLVFSTNNTERLRIDAAGNAGLGVTPSAWRSADRAFQVRNTVLENVNNAAASYGYNYYRDSSAIDRYISSDFASQIVQNNGNNGSIVFNLAASGTAGNPITFTQAMTLEQSSNLKLFASKTTPLSLELRNDDPSVTGGTKFSLNYQGVETGYLSDQFDGGTFNLRLWKPTAGYMAFGINNIERARIAQNGNLLVGRTSDLGYRLDVLSTGNDVAAFSSAQGNLLVSTPALNQTLVSTAGTLLLGAGGSEAARITSARYLKASNTGVYTTFDGTSTAAATFHQFQNDANNINVFAHSTNTGSSVFNFFSELDSGSTGFHYLGRNNGSIVYQVLANGNVQNTNNSYGAISDAKLKENVTDVASYLDRFMQVRFRNFNFIGSDLKQFGVIAQELEAVFPGLVDETPDTVEVTKTRIVEVPAVLDEEGNEVTPATTREEEYTEREPNGEVTKSVKYSILAQIQGKVIQEQQAIIQSQQAQIDAILERLTALEAK